MRSILLLLLLEVLAFGELANFGRLVSQPDDAQRCASTLVLHVLLAAGMALVLVPLIAPTRPGDRQRALVLGFVLALFIPAFGPTGLVIARAIGQRARRTSTDSSVLLDPERELVGHWWRRSRARPRLSARALAEVLRDHAPDRTRVRFQAVLNVPQLDSRDAVALLKLALRDPFEEVRLFAFSRLERLRDDLESDIKKQLKNLELSEGHEKANTHLRLAQVYWEFAYLGLAEGAVREHGLAQANLHATEASHLRLGGSGPAEFLLGRILLAQRHDELAEEAFGRAEKAGHPHARIVPYLAECAFVRRRFDDVRARLRELESIGSPLFMKPVIDFWR